MLVLEKQTLKQKKLRHSEYYSMVGMFDELYARSKNGEIFNHLTEIISSENNIKLAYRNIKRNKGSTTAGHDNVSIKDIEKIPHDVFVKKIQKMLSWYKAKPVKRVEIPKPNGKMRPLGLPSMWDRIVQQCILQVLEPICEAKFYKRSHGFRPNHSAEHALAECYRLAQVVKLHYVIDIDIKGFFDNVNHSKLKKQIWSMGIRDKKLICIISEMLKAPIVLPDGTIENPVKGTPQGGILSPLLSNIVLNELDWWISSQWETIPTRTPYKTRIHANGTVDRSPIYTTFRRNTQLKEMYIVRYADDFKIFCRNRQDAEKAYYAVRKWLNDRLGLQISEEKSKIVNLRKQYSDFLGFKFKLMRKNKGYVICSHMSDKAIQQEKQILKEQIKRMQNPADTQAEHAAISRYNTMVWGIHNYYQYATCISIDCKAIAYEINICLKNRLRERLKKTGSIEELYIRKKYGTSKQMRFSHEKPICPISYVRTKNPMHKKANVCKFTAEGRTEIHKGLEINAAILSRLACYAETDRSIEYLDNRISLYVAQHGKCAVTGRPLEITEMHCHHKLPTHKGGTDVYSNLTIVNEDVHMLIHATEPDTIKEYMSILELTKPMLKKLNKLREMAGLLAIS